MALSDSNGLHTITVSGNLQANTGEALLQSTLSGLGITVLPTWFIGEYLNKGSLQVALPHYTAALPLMSQSAIYALYPSSHFLPPKVRVFLDYLVEKFEANPCLAIRKVGIPLSTDL